MYKTHLHIFLILLVFFPFIQLHSQEVDLEKKISIRAKNKPLGEIINEISEKAGINFSFSNELVPVNKNVTVIARNRPVKEIFDELFKTLEIEYRVVEKQVILRPVRKATPAIDNPVTNTGEKPKETVKYTVSGYLKDKATGEALIGAGVTIKGTYVGTITNSYGFYSLTLSAGDYTLGFSFIGYEPVMQEITLRGNTKVSPELNIANSEIKEVLVIAEEKESMVEKNQMGEVKLTPVALGNLPGFMGEVDIIKSLQSIPGIKSYGDGSTMFYVRGGNNDQNLILIDEAPIYNPAHLFGFFSALAPDAIQDAQVYKGDFPANLGGRLSSVIDIKTKEGNSKRFGFAGSLGPLTSNLSLEAPIIKDRFSFFLSGRRSNLEWMFPDKSVKIYFYDINGKLNFKINDNNRLFLSFYTGKDFLGKISTGTGSFGISWDNKAASLRWNHVFNEKLFSNTTLCASEYNYYLHTHIEKKNNWNSNITNLTLKTDFTWFLNPDNTIKFGASVASHYSNPGNFHVNDTLIQRYIPHIPVYYMRELVLYASNEQQITHRFSVRYGLRIPVWQDIGPTTVFIYDQNYAVSDTLIVKKQEVYTTFIGLEPRLNFNFMLNEKSSLKASYSRTSQNLNLLSNSVSPFTSLEVWAPSGPNIKPQKANQLSFGLFKKIMRKKVDFSIESFYKSMKNQVDYQDHANMLLNPLIEGELRFGKAWAYGVEVLFKKSKGKFNGWAGYTYSRVYKQIIGVNNDKVYPASYDRPHDVSLYLCYDTYNRWVFSANWLYSTGAPITTPTSFYYYNGYTIPVYDSKNNDRLPAYHRLDLSVRFNFNKPGRKFQHNIAFTLYNAYGRKNPVSINFNKIVNDNGKLVIPSDMDGGTEIVPTEISILGVIPSINYNFRF